MAARPNAGAVSCAENPWPFVLFVCFKFEFSDFSPWLFQFQPQALQRQDSHDADATQRIAQRALPAHQASLGFRARCLRLQVAGLGGL